MCLTFRYAKESDCKLILQFIKDLASYEKMLDEVMLQKNYYMNGFLKRKKQK